MAAVRTKRQERERQIAQLEAMHTAALDAYWRHDRLKREALQKAEEYATLLDELEAKR